MRKTEAKTIGGYTYQVTQLGAKQGVSVAARLARILSPVIGGVEGKPSGAALGSGLKAALAGLDEKDLIALSDAFAALTEVTGGEFESRTPKLAPMFDEHFAGHYGDLVNWLLFCVEVNFASFLDEVGIALPESLPKAA